MNIPDKRVNPSTVKNKPPTNQPELKLQHTENTCLDMFHALCNISEMFLL